MALERKSDVASVLERETQTTIASWLARVEDEPNLSSIYLSTESRCAHLPAMILDLVTRERNPLPLSSRVLLLHLMAIEDDEVDWQLAQAMTAYISEANYDGEPIKA